jgi:GH25 family lysozyme M1 (1,4-beta-N-acetylmuramidase)
MHDWERDFGLSLDYYGNKVKHARLAAQRWKELNEAFHVQHLMYTGVSWWNSHVDHSEFIRLAGTGVPFLLAEYPYVEYQGDVWAEAQHWDMLADYQYKTRPAYLRGVNTVGWQFSSRGRLEGYKDNLDLDVMHAWFVGEAYGASWIKRKYHRLKKILQG